MTPRILADDDRGLVVVESHWPVWLVWVAGGLFVAFPIVIVASTPPPEGADLGPLVRLGLGGCMTPLFVVPFLVVLTVSRYRRFDILPGRAVLVHTIFRLFPRRTEEIAWDDIRVVECVRLPGGARRPDGMRVTVERTGGSARVALGGWWSDEVAAALRKHLGERYRVFDPRG